MYHIFNIPTLAPGVEYKLCQTCIPMSFLSLFSTQSIFIQFYGKCTHFVQLPECNFPMPLIYFKVCFFWIQMLLQQHFFTFCHVSTPCSYWTHLVRTVVTYVELEGQPHKLAEVSPTVHYSCFFFLFQGLPLFMFPPPEDCMQAAGGRILALFRSCCMYQSPAVVREMVMACWNPLFGPTWQHNLEAAQIHSRSILREHLGAGASQNAFSSWILIYNTTTA